MEWISGSMGSKATMLYPCSILKSRGASANQKITIALTWTAYEHHVWEQFSSTVRHELAHAWQYHEFGEADHGEMFERWTDALDTTQYCERFKLPNW